MIESATPRLILSFLRHLKAVQNQLHIILYMPQSLAIADTIVAMLCGWQNCEQPRVVMSNAVSYDDIMEALKSALGTNIIPDTKPGIEIIQLITAMHMDITQIFVTHVVFFFAFKKVFTWGNVIEMNFQWKLMMQDFFILVFLLLTMS